MNLIPGTKEESVKIAALAEKILVFHVLKNDGEMIMFCRVDEHKILSIGETPIWLTNGLCPTCECLLRYGNAGDWVGVEDGINQPFKDLRTSFEAVKPLLALLPAGLYVLRVSEHYPLCTLKTFFWAGKYITWNNEMGITKDYSRFLIPTQPPKRFNPERAEYYRDKPDIYGITLKGAHDHWCPTFLLDGHHKAVAAALEGRMLKTVQIDCAIRNLELSGMIISLSDEEIKQLEVSDTMPFSDELLNSARKYDLRNEIADRR
jgi:hypothetical protein